MTSTEKDILLIEKDKLILEQKKQNREQLKQIEELKFQIKQLRKLIFSSKRERVILNTNPNQGNLFGQQEVTPPAQAEDQRETKIAKKRKASRKGITRNVFPPHLLRVEQYIYPDDFDDQESEVIGEDVTEILIYHEASLSVKKIVRPIYKTKDDKIIQAGIPARTIPKGMVDESVISNLINEKIQHHTPLHRQAKKLKQQGLSFVKKSNVENWFSKGIDALVPLYNLHEQEIIKQDYLQVDESGIKVLRKNKIGSAHRGQMWVANDPVHKSVLFKYDPSRSEKAGLSFLNNYTGTYLQSDGYIVYEKIAKNKGIKLIYCAAHARRKFKDWLEVQLHNPEILPNDRLGKAIAYSYKRWKGLIAYCNDGRLEIDNNLIENNIRPLALGRKNYLFAGSDYGAQNLAIGYSLVNTCIKNNINPAKYLTWVLKKIANNKVNHQAKMWLPQYLNEDNYNLLKI